MTTIRVTLDVTLNPNGEDAKYLMDRMTSAFLSATAIGTGVLPG